MGKVSTGKFRAGQSLATLPEFSVVGEVSSDSWGWMLVS
jgi:hypothetical protein